MAKNKELLSEFALHLIGKTFDDYRKEVIKGYGV